MTTNKEPKVWYKRKVFWTAVVAAAGVVLDMNIGEQSAIIEFVMLVIGGL